MFSCYVALLSQRAGLAGSGRLALLPGVALFATAVLMHGALWTAGGKLAALASGDWTLRGQILRTLQIANAPLTWNYVPHHCRSSVVGEMATADHP